MSRWPSPVARPSSSSDLRVQTDLEPAETTGDPHLLGRMISNLVDNAVRHNTQGGEVSLESGICAGRAFFRITNSGQRIPDALLPVLFEPFRRMEGRTGPSGGAGLGLAIARSVAAAHGAALDAHARPAGGLDVRVFLPAHPARPGQPASDPAPPAGQRPAAPANPSGYRT